MFALLIKFTVATNHVVYDLDFPVATNQDNFDEYRPFRFP